MLQISLSMHARLPVKLLIGKFIASKPGGGRTAKRMLKDSSWFIFIWSKCILEIASRASLGPWTLTALTSAAALTFIGSMPPLCPTGLLASTGIDWSSSFPWAKLQAAPLLHWPLELNWKHNLVPTKLGAFLSSSGECAKLHSLPMWQRLARKYLHIWVNFKVFRVSWVVIVPRPR